MDRHRATATLPKSVTRYVTGPLSNELFFERGQLCADSAKVATPRDRLSLDMALCLWYSPHTRHSDSPQAHAPRAPGRGSAAFVRAAVRVDAGTVSVACVDTSGVFTPSFSHDIGDNLLSHDNKAGPFPTQSPPQQADGWPLRLRLARHVIAQL